MGEGAVISGQLSVGSSFPSMRHRVKNDIDPQGIRILLGKLLEIPRVRSLLFPAVAEIRVVADDHPHAPLVVEHSLVVYFLASGVMPLIRDAAAASGDGRTDTRNLRLLRQVEDDVEDVVRERKFLRFPVGKNLLERRVEG